MAKRSTRIILSNASPVDLTLIGSHLDHGIWSDNLQPQQTILHSTTSTWQSESSGFMTGTQGWVQYKTTNIDLNCNHEIVQFNWDNPYVWDSGTNPIACSLTVELGLTNKYPCANELFGVSADASGQEGITWWDIIAPTNWWVVLALAAVDDINLTFSFGLRRKESVADTMQVCSAILGLQDIRTVTQQFNQPSLRTLFHM